MLILMTNNPSIPSPPLSPPSPPDTSQVSFTYEAFEEAVAATDYSFNRNDVIKGTIVQYDNGGAIVDIGAKASAFLPLAEAGLITEAANEKQQIEEMVQLDVEREFQIISEEDENGQLLVSIRRIEYRQAWERISALQIEDQVFEAEVVSVNRGGAIALVEGLRAFLPGSHLTGALPDEDLVGTTLPLKFLEVNQEANKVRRGGEGRTDGGKRCWSGDGNIPMSFDVMICDLHFDDRRSD